MSSPDKRSEELYHTWIKLAIRDKPKAKYTQNEIKNGSITSEMRH